jgi:hypothetical protein
MPPASGKIKTQVYVNDIAFKTGGDIILNPGFQIKI